MEHICDACLGQNTLWIMFVTQVWTKRPSLLPWWQDVQGICPLDGPHVSNTQDINPHVGDVRMYSRVIAVASHQRYINFVSPDTTLVSLFNILAIEAVHYWPFVVDPRTKGQ